MTRLGNGRAAFFALGFFGALLIQMSQGLEQVFSSDEPMKPGAQGEPSPATGVRVSDGVIGVSLHVGAERVGDTAALFIAHVLPDGPAQKAGLKQGDELTAVDGVAIAGKTYEEVALMVRGEPGSTVKLGVKGQDGTHEVTVTRVAGQSLYKAPMGSHGGATR